MVPNTYPDEPSYPASTDAESLAPRRGKKRSASRQPFAEPTNATQQDDEPPPKVFTILSSSFLAF